jgi:thioesterase domain-containing protein
MACQLRDAGEEVALLLLLDTSVPNPHELAEYLETVEEKSAKEEPSLTARMRMRLGALRSIFKKPEPAAPVQHPRGQASYPPTLMRHKLRPYPGTVTLVVDEESSQLHGLLGWDKAAIGSLESHILSGNHITYIREHSEDAARKLHEILARTASKP